MVVACPDAESLLSIFQPLRKALSMMGAPNLISENMEYGLSYSIVSYLKKLGLQVRGMMLLFALSLSLLISY